MIFLPKRFEVYVVSFHGEGSEQKGKRPAIIVQNDTGNASSPTVIVCPFTAERKPRLPTHVALSKKDCAVKKPSTVLCEQVRVVDKSRLKRYLFSVTKGGVQKKIKAALISAMDLASK